VEKLVKKIGCLPSLIENGGLRLRVIVAEGEESIWADLRKRVLGCARGEIKIFLASNSNDVSKGVG
jgi:hypothetical protein